MKWIIYSLLIFNIGFAAWHFRGIDSQQGSTQAALSINNENQLVLLSEFREQQKAGKKESAGKLCYSLGPFLKKSNSDKAMEILSQGSIEANRIRLRDTSRKGFWVILPASKTRKEAYQHITRLKKHKIKDYFLVATGKHANAVSLGVFSQKKLARRRVDEMIRLGFVPRMESVALPRKVYWLNWYKDQKQQPEAAVLSELKKEYPKVSKVERSCK